MRLLISSSIIHILLETSWFLACCRISQLPSAASCCHVTKFRHKEYEHNWYVKLLDPPLKRKLLAFGFIPSLHLMKWNVDMVFV